MDAANASNQQNLNPKQLVLLPPLLQRLDQAELGQLKNTAGEIIRDFREQKRNRNLEAQGITPPPKGRHRKKKLPGAKPSAAEMGKKKMDPLEVKTLRRQRQLGILTSKLEIDQTW